MAVARSNLILLVASDPSVIASLRYRLDRDEPGYVLMSAPTLQDALAQISADRYACILADLELPDSPALEIVSALADAAPDVPIVALHGDDALGLQAIVAGADEHLADSLLRGNVLARAVGHAVARRRTVVRRPAGDAQRETLDSLLGLILRYADLAASAGDLGTVSRNLRGLRNTAEQARDLVLMEAGTLEPAG
jgi:DNA-binding NarL/FixJ family response regulator